MTKPILRFAPSPNGDLHLGHAYSALFTWARAKQLGGTALLRIEDIDLGRCRPEYVVQIYDDLSWLGLDWPKPVRIQSQHFADYRAALEQLETMGLLYRCFCTRKQVLVGSDGSKDPDGGARYGGVCKHLSAEEIGVKQQAGDAFALRLDMNRAFAQLNREGKTNLLAKAEQYADVLSWGDVVLVRKDIPTSYHLSVVVDDAEQNITHVTRGMDMFASTAIHILLQGLLNLPTPHYEHHHLIEDETGRKLAKSLRDRSIRVLRQDGVSVPEIKKIIGIDEGFAFVF